MFDLQAIKQMGQDIELFTTQTGAALTDMTMQLRVLVALAAMTLADQRQERVTTGTSESTNTPLDIINQAIEIANEGLSAELAEGDGGGE